MLKKDPRDHRLHVGGASTSPYRCAVLMGGRVEPDLSCFIQVGFPRARQSKLRLIGVWLGVGQK